MFFDRIQRVRMHKKTNRSQHKNKIIFSTGATLFLIGFLGMIYNLWINPSNSASNFLPKNTVVFTEINTQKNNLEKLDKFNFTDLIEGVLQENLPNISREDLTPWIGKKLSIAWLPKNQFILAAKYRNKKAAKDFMQKNLIAGEDFAEKNINGFIVYSPSFSSQISFVFKDNWLITATSAEAVQSVLENETPLAQSENYARIIRDLPRNSEIISYLNFSELSQLTNPLISAKKPLIKALTKTIPALGLSINIEKNELSLNSKIITTNGIFSTELLENTPNEVVPELAQYSPQDVLFFMNGYDLNAKYLHTKKFLEEFHPQFSLIFDGVLRSEFKKIFGQNFDFHNDLLNRIKGQYAIIFNFTNDENPFTYFTLITKFSNVSDADGEEEMKIIIKKAQQQYSTKIVEHQLPDGSSRKELVIADPEEINLAEKSASSYSYFTTETETDSTIPQQKFSYGFLNNFLIFSNHEDGLKDVFEAYTTNVNLTKNEDFRESVLFDFSASESYGFINNNKLATLVSLTQKSSDEEVNKYNLASILEYFRNTSFSRKTFPQEVLFSAQLKNR